MAGERTGRPRSESAHAAIPQAARELILEIGYAKLSTAQRTRNQDAQPTGDYDLE